ncbi:hypothetical protein [Pseudophaeobacter sp.]
MLSVFEFLCQMLAQTQPIVVEPTVGFFGLKRLLQLRPVSPNDKPLSF